MPAGRRPRTAAAHVGGGDAYGWPPTRCVAGVADNATPSRAGVAARAWQVRHVISTKSVAVLGARPARTILSAGAPRAPADSVPLPRRRVPANRAAARPREIGTGPCLTWTVQGRGRAEAGRATRRRRRMRTGRS